jgi:isoleucyl-tRNA synthetase
MSEPNKPDYSKSLNVPKPDVKNPDGVDTNPSSIPQRANLPKREPGILEFWRQNDIYGKSLEPTTSRGTFVLHDGPPFSNGDIHIGHGFNKILKDVIVKFKSMQGYKAPYVPGWDNNGLPIEVAVSKEFREKKVTPTPTEMRVRCREFAMHWVERQKAQFERLGIRGDWDNPYLTASPKVAAKQLEVFADMVDKGYVYKGLKPVYWSLVDETALADHEVEYEDRKDPSIFVRFPLVSDPNGIFGGSAPSIDRCYTIIWTTTPWTIPANVAVAMGPEVEYAVVEHEGDRYLLAADRIGATMAAANFTGWQVVNTLTGADLKDLVFKHPLFDRPAPAVLVDYVSTGDGTGIVHTAPGHGKDDFMTGQKYGLPTIQVLTGNGYFNEQAGEAYAGLRKDAGEKKVLEDLAASGALLAHETIEHSYPHGWRSHDPLVFRATEQWFVNIDNNGHREKCLKDIDDVQWFPPESIQRIKAMVSGRPDWCISRQRSWGVGIPVFYAQPSGTPLLTKESVLWVRELVAREGTDSWFEKDAKDIIPAGFKHPETGETEFTKETDIFDVWFDSGSTCRTVLTQWPGLTYPADVYLEGGDQHRGWFNASLMVGEATTGKAPFRQVITNGWTLDEQGKKFSKSKMNGVAPSVVTEKYGADVLRLWVCSTDYFADVRVGDKILEQVATNYRTIRNTLRFMLGNLYSAEPRDFDPVLNGVEYAKLPEIDRWALHRLNEVVRASVAAYEAYEFPKVTQSVLTYCTADLSAFYLDVIKDRLYTYGVDSFERRSAQTVLFEITSTLARLMSPILSFTMEEVWQKLNMPEKPISVELAALPSDRAEFRDSELAARWDKILGVRDEVNKTLEGVKNRRELAITLVTDAGTYEALNPYLNQLPAVLMVSEVELRQGTAAGVEVLNNGPAGGVKCARCWVAVGDGGDDPAAACAGGCMRSWRAVSTADGAHIARRLLPG